MTNKFFLIAMLILTIIVVLYFVYALFFSKTKIKKDLGETRVATFAGGCFWCVESDFEKLASVEEAISGYTGGTVENPEYKEVSAGKTGHLESVQVYYNPDRIEYRELVRYFFRHVDPTDAEGSFGDRGKQYASAIFYGNAEEKNIAEEEKARLNDAKVFDKEIATVIEPLGEFYVAEGYHQDYYNNHSIRYNYYRNGSGRDQFLDSVWKSAEVNVKEYLKATRKFDLSKLTPIQFHVTQEEGTEKPFENEYDSEKRDGIYVDIVSGEALFSSLDKYDSKTGWPSFTKPIAENAVVEKIDKKLFVTRIEIRSPIANSHLGHVFDDGPEPTGKRYCMNSAALRFILKEDLEKEGYGEYQKMFK